MRYVFLHFSVLRLSTYWKTVLLLYNSLKGYLKASFPSDRVSLCLQIGACDLENATAKICCSGRSSCICSTQSQYCASGERCRGQGEIRVGFGRILPSPKQTATVHLPQSCFFHPLLPAAPIPAVPGDISNFKYWGH